LTASCADNIEANETHNNTLKSTLVSRIFISCYVGLVKGLPTYMTIRIEVNRYQGTAGGFPH
jgi:hypothetical protein